MSNKHFKARVLGSLIIKFSLNQNDITMTSALNQPESWDKMTKMIGENSIESYARAIDQITQRIQITKQPTIDLKDIREGRLIMQLNAMNIELISSAEKDYQQWLEWQFLSNARSFGSNLATCFRVCYRDCLCCRDTSSWR